MLKKTILVTLTGSILLASGVSFADPYYRNGRREVVVEHERFYRPAPRPVFVREIRRPVVVERPVYVQPAPVYHANGLAILAGAIIGGAVAYNIANNH
jgi:hypothetical protein